MTEPLNFGENGYISFTDDSSPDFFGEYQSIDEFIQSTFEQNQIDNETGGMTLE